MSSPALNDGPLPDVPGLALAWTKAGRKAVLASVTSTWGSAPRPAGSQLVVRDDQHFEGSVSGGCIEGDVITAASDMMAGGAPKQLEYGVSNDEAWQVGLACGGRIGVYLQPVDAQLGLLLEELQARRQDNQQTLFVTRLSDGRSYLHAPGDELEIGGPELGQAADEVLRTDRAASIEIAGTEFFLNPFNPPLRLFVIGAVHIAQALVPMAELAGFAVTVIDPRGLFSSKARLGEAAVVEDWPDDVLGNIGLDRRSAVITLTHDPKLDDAALQVALNSEAFYIGCLGSRKTHAARLERLTAKGFDETALERIHGPLGLDIGAKTPGEIAASALAQVIATLRGQSR